MYVRPVRRNAGGAGRPRPQRGALGLREDACVAVVALVALVALVAIVPIVPIVAIVAIVVSIV